MGQGCPIHGSISGLYPTDANSNLHSCGSKCLQLLANVTWGNIPSAENHDLELTEKELQRINPRVTKGCREGKEGRTQGREEGREDQEVFQKTLICHTSVTGD